MSAAQEVKVVRQKLEKLQTTVYQLGLLLWCFYSAFLPLQLVTFICHERSTFIQSSATSLLKHKQTQDLQDSLIEHEGEEEHAEGDKEYEDQDEDKEDGKDDK